jgi:hypothetical protein
MHGGRITMHGGRFATRGEPITMHGGRATLHGERKPVHPQRSTIDGPRAATHGRCVTLHRRPRLPPRYSGEPPAAPAARPPGQNPFPAAAYRSNLPQPPRLLSCAAGRVNRSYPAQALPVER